MTHTVPVPCGAAPKTRTRRGFLRQKSARAVPRWSRAGDGIPDWASVRLDRAPCHFKRAQGSWRTSSKYSLTDWLAPLPPSPLPPAMVSHHYVPAPPLARGRDRVSRKLRLSRQEKIKLRLTLSALFVACFTGLWLLIDILASPDGFPAPRDEYRSSDAPGFDKLPSMSTSWAYYSPYHPAAEFEGSTREGCVVSQVNIVSPVPPPDRSVSIHH